FAMNGELKSDHAFHRLFCDVVDVEPRETAESFLGKYFTSDAPAMLLSCVQKASGEKACQQRKAAMEMLVKLRYEKARPTLEKLERARQDQKQHPTPQSTQQYGCFGDSITKALDQLK